MGRITFSSNPTRTTGESTDGWTRATKDDAGRVIEVASFNGAAQPPSSGTNANWTGSVLTSYNAEQTTVTDQALKKRRSVVDGLGRLKQVDELLETGALYASTTYTYDVLGNLTFVNQGAQQRQFVYDSLSRLRQAYNPEQVNGSGVKIATLYQYDDASNLTLKTNPNGTTVGFTYDGLNRVATKSLSTGGVWIYAYDVGTNYKGRMVSDVLQGSTDGYYYDGYDAAGRVTSSHQITAAGAAQGYTMSYKYDLAGNLTSQTYPSNKEYRTNFDNAGRVASVSRYNTGVFDKTYASQFSYSAHGAVAAMTFGNSLIDKTEFNSRLQPIFIKLGATGNPTSVLQLGYTYNTPGQANNNGNVLTQTITAPKAAGGNLVLTQNYSYDALNRLSFAEELIVAASQWNQTYDIDRWGNRAVNSASTYIPSSGLTPQSLTTFDTATNRIKPAQMAGIGYDTSGNLTSQPNPGIGTDPMVYDAENHQTSYTKSGSGGGTTSYSYDGEGRRVKKTDPSNNATIFVYNVAGQLIAEYTSGAPSGGGTSYLTSDHLGSTRVVTKQDGTVKARYDYLPFGEEIGSDHGSRTLVTGYGVTEATRQKFTQKERDSESGLDYFGERYYSSAQGRFTTCDPLGSSMRASDPQTMNRYVFVLNNPLRYVDPDGLKETDPWNQLSEEERKIITPKLVIPKGQTAQSVFNGLVTVTGNASGTRENVTAIKNFIDVVGGHTNSAVWQQIGSIAQVTGGEAGSSLIHVDIPDRGKFLDALRAEKDASGNPKYAVNDWEDKKFGDHKNDTIRQWTETSLNFPIHFANDSSDLNRYFAHFDPSSPYFRSATFDYGLGAFLNKQTERIAASKLHNSSHVTPTQVREYLKRTGQVPSGER